MADGVWWVSESEVLVVVLVFRLFAGCFGGLGDGLDLGTDYVYHVSGDARMEVLVPDSITPCHLPLVLEAHHVNSGTIGIPPTSVTKQCQNSFPILSCTFAGR